MDFGHQMKALRKSRRISQQDLAKLTGYSQTYISSIEQRTYAPRGDVLEIISGALGVSCGYWYKAIHVIKICPMCGYELEID